MRADSGRSRSCERPAGFEPNPDVSQPIETGLRRVDAHEEPKVCRLPAGGDWIRTSRTRARLALPQPKAPAPEPMVRSLSSWREVDSNHRSLSYNQYPKEARELSAQGQPICVRTREMLGRSRTAELCHIPPAEDARRCLRLCSARNRRVEG